MRPSFAGPPPDAPQPSVSYPLDRISRKREQASLLKEGQNAKVDPAKPTSALSKRFWRNVSVKEDENGALQILLDARPVRTASKQPLTLPKSKRALATAIAVEWDSLVSAQQALKGHYIPMTSMVSRALDIERADAEGSTVIREQIAKMVMRYLSTDTLLCWAPEHNIHDPSEAERNGGRNLRRRQEEAAAPIIAFLTTHVFPGVELVPILGEDSIIPISQPQLTQDVIRGWTMGLPAYELAALERGVLATKSLLIAARLLVGWSAHWSDLRKQGDTAAEFFGIEEAAEVATLEVLHQTQQWGEVEDTHDVEKEDLRRQLGSVLLMVS